MNPTPFKPADDREEVYFNGSPSLKGEVGTLVICAVIAIVLIVAGGFISAGTGMWLIVIPVAVLLAAATFIYPVVMAKFTHYKITNYRVDFEYGILSKSIDTLELWHVEDISFHQSLINRMLGVGTLTIVSGDETTPNLLLKGLPEPRKLFELLKQRIISVKRQRGVLKIDNS